MEEIAKSAQNLSAAETEIFGLLSSAEALVRDFQDYFIRFRTRLLITTPK